MKLNITQSDYINKVIKACRELVENSNVNIEKYLELEKPLLQHNTLYAETSYRFIEAVSHLLDDKYLGFLLGEKLFENDLSNKSLHDNLLVSLINVFSKQTMVAYYATFHLDIIKDRMIIGLKREKSIRHSSQYMDEVILGYIVSLIKYYVVDAYSPDKLIIQSHKDIFIPERHQLSSNVMSGRYEVSINIPVIWVNDMPMKRKEEELENKVETTIESILRLCSFNVTNVDWNINQLSKECHLSVRTLQRLLANHKTSFRKIMLQEKLSYAKNKLNEKISPREIATQLGFSDVTAFGRFFKKESGVTVTQYCDDK
ncbi:helix-turn-helix transcriptional regulator [Photobacterium rosenbergii]|uniref:Helix-turn-helix transcriptional regulator n=1 Tax=Photobacterium rosenbergii TaxID=294936 RepID=A0ABU3ZHM9_9GAMM|nr:helix-turn-helix transcriptional regulator [Photobacterium rosenbergii]MDV5169638.1 helix-turn-helix transcriptional regulator [Photobacterium rosenbergii]